MKKSHSENTVGPWAKQKLDALESYLAAWMLDGIFIGATRSADMRNMMAVSFAIYTLSLWLLLEPFGNNGLWASLMIFFVARGVTLGLRYPALERAAAKN